MASFMVAALAWCIPIVMLTFALEVITVRRWRGLPPGPRPLPVIGNFHAIAWSRAHRSLAQLAERHGPLMTIWLGRRAPTIVVSTPDAAREVLLNADLAGRPPMDAWRAEGHSANSIINLPPHDKWRAMRRFATAELLTKGRLDDAQQERVGEKLQEMARNVSEHAARGEPVDVGHAAFATVLDLLLRALFSVDLGTEELRRKVKEASLLAATPTISDAVPALAAADLQGARRKLGALIRYAHRIIDEQFARRRRGRDAGEPRKNDMTDVVLDKEQEWREGGSPMNYDAVKGMFTELRQLQLPSSGQWQSYYDIRNG